MSAWNCEPMMPTFTLPSAMSSPLNASRGANPVWERNLTQRREGHGATETGYGSGIGARSEDEILRAGRLLTASTLHSKVTRMRLPFRAARRLRWTYQHNGNGGFTWVLCAFPSLWILGHAG